MAADDDKDLWEQGKYQYLKTNAFARLKVLQNAIIHLMKPTERHTLEVGLDGDFAAILALMSAESEVIGEAMKDSRHEMARILGFE